jgi:hypothetical protein
VPAPPESPEALFRELPRTGKGVGGLWTHQGAILGQYVSQYASVTDVALELPTGTGKTLPGLLIADWSRRARPERAAYGCPTQQLARQVHAAAGREGIPAVLLVGSHTGWALADVTRYDAAQAVAIVTYNTVFNSSPKLTPPGILLFDDAHAGEQHVADSYVVTISRRDRPAAYAELLAALSPGLDGMFLQRLHEDEADPNVRQLTKLVLPLRDGKMTSALDAALMGLPQWSNEGFNYSMIRGQLRACLAYVAWDAILVRPFVPPTAENRLFADARQRVYLSATLGDGGELERAFGRAPIDRLPLPAEAGAPRSGRRFFVFPDIVDDANPLVLTKTMVEAAGKALVLTPDGATAERLAGELAPDGWPVLGRDDVQESLAPLAEAEHAVCGLASRYDGLDLPDQACRAVVLAGLPSAQHLQERYLSTRVKAGAALAERVRTRVVQGAGRCTRGPQDWALVVVLGPDLARYLSRPEVRQAMDPELQAEIEFGLENSRVNSTTLMANVDAFLAHDERWQDGAEPALAEFRRAAERVVPEGTDQLAAAVAHEIDACGHARQGDFEQASAAARRAADAMGGNDATRPYRAFWLYLAGMWLDEAGATAGTPALRQSARNLVRQAAETARPATWVRELRPLPEDEAVDIAPADLDGARQIAARLESGVNKAKHQESLSRMHTGLAATDPGLYEPALSHLGKLLGAEASKPAGQGRCDSAWCWDELLWLAIEAKSDHDPAGQVSLSDVRQANSHLRLIAADRGQDAPPPDSATVIVSPRLGVDPTAVDAAEPHVHLTSPQILGDLARTAEEFWSALLASNHSLRGGQLVKLVIALLNDHALLASQVRERLTATPIRA